ncbi:MAG: hypothetical protein COA78_01825 [Blastopirellula sp.]|nr:MAG: hypothetical protein COA78_01825 [Blastopirellula sp.]
MSNLQSDRESATGFILSAVGCFLFVIMCLAFAITSTNVQGVVVFTLYSLWFIMGAFIAYRNYQRVKHGVLHSDSTRIIQCKEQAVFFFILVILSMVLAMTSTSMVIIVLFSALSLSQVFLVIERYRKSCELKRRVELLKSDSEP